MNSPTRALVSEVADKGIAWFGEKLKNNPNIVSQVDNFRKTCLHWAVGLYWKIDLYQTDILSLLLNNGADIDAQDRNGDTSLHVAASISGFNGEKIVKLLINGGANLNVINNNGITPLHISASEGSLDTARILILHNSDVNAKDNQGFTALHLTVLSKNLDHMVKLTMTIDLLLENRAVIDANDNNGKTPLELSVLPGVRSHLETYWPKSTPRSTFWRSIRYQPPASQACTTERDVVLAALSICPWNNLGREGSGGREYGEWHNFSPMRIIVDRCKLEELLPIFREWCKSIREESNQFKSLDELLKLRHLYIVGGSVGWGHGNSRNQLTPALRHYTGKTYLRLGGSFQDNASGTLQEIFIVLRTSYDRFKCVTWTEYTR